MTRQRQAFATLDSLQRMMDVTDERQTGLRSVVPEIRSGALHLIDVSFRYPGASRNSISNLHIAIKPGERVGIIGRVASGKSTFGRVLCGLYPPTEGEMLIDGLDSRQYHPHQLREQFRFVAQDADVFSGSVRDNLKLGSARANDTQLVDAVVRSGADIFLSRDAAGFDLDVGERGGRLSGGQRALLILARALVTPSKLLFLDEPTGSMDTQTELYFIEHLKGALAKDQTLIVATHRHNMLSILDRLIVIDAGRILADGPRDEVLKQMTKGTNGNAA
jgi:ATP-binding cassette subfamily C protein LapB